MKLKELFEKQKQNLELYTYDKFEEYQEVLPFDINIWYEVERGGHSDHPYGESYAREYHQDNINVYYIESAEEIVEEDEDGKVIKTWPKGVDVTTLPFFKNSKYNKAWWSQEIYNNL